MSPVPQSGSERPSVQPSHISPLCVSVTIRSPASVEGSKCRACSAPPRTHRAERVFGLESEATVPNPKCTVHAQFVSTLDDDDQYQSSCVAGNNVVSTTGALEMSW